MNRAAVIELTHAFQAAVQRRDLPFLETHLAAEFTLTTGRSGAPVRGRDEWLAITADRYVIHDFAFEEVDVIELGVVAVARSRYRQSGSLDGADRSSTFLLTDVWAIRDGRPQLVTRHSTALEDG